MFWSTIQIEKNKAKEVDYQLMTWIVLIEICEKQSDIQDSSSISKEP